jgi:archaellum component FlaC
MTDWVVAGVLGIQTVIMVYVSSRINRINKSLERVSKSLNNIAVELLTAQSSITRIQEDMHELEDLIKTALRD